MATRKNRLPQEYLSWKVVYDYHEGIQTPYPFLSAQAVANDDQAYLSHDEHKIVLRGKEIQILMHFKGGLTIPEMITMLTEFESSCNPDCFDIDVKQLAYDAGFHTSVYFSGWRPMTKEELKEATVLREQVNAERKEREDRWRAIEIERARKLLKDVGEL
jgi:hypothetical protein